jgi:hypothetical protein
MCLLTLGAFWLWWLAAALRVNGLVNDHNRDVAVETLRNLVAIRAHSMPSAAAA